MFLSIRTDGTAEADTFPNGQVTGPLNRHGILMSYDESQQQSLRARRILCETFYLEFDSLAFMFERRLIKPAFNLNHAGKCETTIFGDAHLMNLAKLHQSNTSYMQSTV